MTPSRQARAPRGLDRRAHRLGIGMQGQHRHAHPDDVLDALGDGVVDVEQLHVEEDSACRRRPARGRNPARRQRRADSRSCRRRRRRRVRPPPRPASRWHVEADDQAVAHVGPLQYRRHAPQTSSLVDSCVARSISVRQPSPSDAPAFVLERAVLVESLLRMRHRALRRDDLGPAVHQHGAQMIETANAAEMAVGGRAQRRNLAGKRMRRLAVPLTRLTQSIVFFSSGGIEALYSGLAINRPSWAAISRASFTAFRACPSPLQILVHDRQRIVGKRDAGHFGALQRQFLLAASATSPTGAGADRTGEDKDSRGADRPLHRSSAIGDMPLKANRASAS